MRLTTELIINPFGMAGNLTGVPLPPCSVEGCIEP